MNVINGDRGAGLLTFASIFSGDYSKVSKCRAGDIEGFSCCRCINRLINARLGEHSAFPLRVVTCICAVDYESIIFIGKQVRTFCDYYIVFCVSVAGVFIRIDE